MKNLLLDTLVEVVGYRTDKHSLRKPGKDVYKRQVQILAVLTMDGCLSSELYDKAHQDLSLIHI